MTVVFVDTNVLLYALDTSEPDKQPRAKAWMRELWSRRVGRLSAQVLQEYYFNATTRLDPGLTPAEARVEVRALEAWRPLAGDASLVRAAWDIEDRFGFSFWDGLIVAAARRLEADYLLTEDLQNGQVLDGLTVIDPFRHPPDEILK